MKIEFTASPLDQAVHRCMVVLADKTGKLLNGLPVLQELLAPFVASKEFGTSFGNTVYLTEPKGVAAERVLFFNVGSEIKVPNDIRRATARAWKGLRSKGFDGVLFSLDGLADAHQRRAAVEGFQFGNYQYTAFKTDPDSIKQNLDTLLVHSSVDYAADITRWVAVARGTIRARDLCQAPANVMTPSRLAAIAHEWSTDMGLKVTVLDRKELEEEKMGCMLSVAQGSDQEPKLIIMEYVPRNPSGKTVALVGKAVTFDSGGYNLKLSKMEEMKGDMGGGATVFGIMSVLQDVDCPHRVIGVVPAVENMVSGRATRPSDVVTSKAGITVEINNTDAEGRLILVDALTYSKRFEADYVVDFATLTGACVVALGPKVFGVMGNHQPLIDAIVAAGGALHETFWQLPLFEDYKDLLDSSVADISNISSSRWGGAITAGLFLERFARDYKWAHCDIAASIFEKGDDYSPAGGVGAGVRTMLDVFNQLDSLG